MTELARNYADPSLLFTSGEFVDIASHLQTENITGIPLELAPSYRPYRMQVTRGLLHYYQWFTNRLIDEERLLPPQARINKTQEKGLIVNQGRSKRPQGEATEIPIMPGNEHMTPPPLLVVQNDDNWLLRVFFNAFPYGYPRREILEDTSTRRVETVPTLSLVCALNPAIRPIHDQHFRNTEFMELWMHTLGVVSRLILEEGTYLDKPAGRQEHYGSVIGFMNEGKGAGGSLPWPHAQIVAYPDCYAPPFYEGLDATDLGDCDRCNTVNIKLRIGANGRVLGITETALAYSPETEQPAKGEAIRITPISHVSNWEEASRNPRLVKDVAGLVHASMASIASGQDQPSYNVVWAQGFRENTHAFVQVQTGTPAGGFAIVRPLFTLENGSRIEPDISYADPEDIAAKHRVTLFFRKFH